MEHTAFHLLLETAHFGWLSLLLHGSHSCPAARWKLAGQLLTTDLALREGAILIWAVRGIYLCSASLGKDIPGIATKKFCLEFVFLFLVVFICWFVFFYNEGVETLEQISQSGRWPSLESIQGQVWQGFEQPDVVEDGPPVGGLD